MAVPVGPRRVTKVRQVATPAALLRQVGLQIGDEVYFEVRDDDRGAIRIVPASRAQVSSR